MTTYELRMKVDTEYPLREVPKEVRQKQVADTVVAVLFGPQASGKAYDMSLTEHPND